MLSFKLFFRDFTQLR